MVLGHSTQSLGVAWVQRGSELTVFSPTLTYACFLFVNLSYYLCPAVKGSREEGVDEETIEKDAKVRSKNMRKTRKVLLFVVVVVVFPLKVLCDGRFLAKNNRSLFFMRDTLSINNPCYTVATTSQRKHRCFSIHSLIVLLQCY